MAIKGGRVTRTTAKQEQQLAQGSDEDHGNMLSEMSQENIENPKDMDKDIARAQ